MHKIFFLQTKINMQLKYMFSTSSSNLEHIMQTLYPYLLLKKKKVDQVFLYFLSWYHTCLCACMLSHSVIFDSLRPFGLQPTRLCQFFRQEYWSGLPFSSPGDLPNPRIEAKSSVSPAVSSFPSEPSGKPIIVPDIISKLGTTLIFYKLDACGNPFFIPVQITLWWFSRQVVSDSCDPMDYSPSGSSVHGISQVELLWVAISFSRGSSRPRDETLVSYTAGRFFTN